MTRGADPEVLVSTGDPRTARFRADAATATLALAHLAREHPRFLFLGLGEPDELAHQGDYPGYLQTLRQADAILGELVLTLSRMGERGRRTSIFVTCDHGRAKDFRHHGARWPESSRAWLVAVGGGVPARGVVRGPASHELRDIAPTIRVLLGLPPDRSPLAGTPIRALLPVQQ
jgi:arylsulfatase A-like enzyme